MSGSSTPARITAACLRTPKRTASGQHRATGDCRKQPDTHDIGRSRRYGNQKREEGKKVNSNINVTPMVDVMLVLLIIFMVITPMLNNKVNVDLPKVTRR